MVILGLTGSIGMGKSTVARMLRRLGVPVHDADAAVHRLMGRGGRAVKAVSAAFPGVEAEGAIDRKKLGAAVFGEPAALRRLEGILHPMVREETERFLARQARRGARLVVLDIPLLFETRATQRVDAVLVVSAPAHLQRDRVLARPGMTEARLAQILAQQTPDREKRRRADFLLINGLSRAETLKRLRRIVTLAEGLPARHWPPRRQPLHDGI